MELLEFGLEHFYVRPGLLRQDAGVLAPQPRSAVLVWHIHVFEPFCFNEVMRPVVSHYYKVWLVVS